MSEQLTTGMRHTIQTKVEAHFTATAFGSGDIAVYATPCMIMHMEIAAKLCVSDRLKEGETTVGSLVNIKHLAATPTGMNITIEAVLTEIDNRRLTFEVRCHDDKGLVGEGIHERFIVNSEKFLNKANERKINL